MHGETVKYFSICLEGPKKPTKTAARFCAAPDNKQTLTAATIVSLLANT
jgi:hypothetical protein